MKKIYLAGPDVFYQFSAERYEMLKTILRYHGLEGIAPVDCEIPANIHPNDQSGIAEAIYQNNIKLIRECDGVMANVAPFRGKVEPDSGTVFEIGFAIALNKPVAVYADCLDRSWESRIEDAFGCMNRRDIEFGHMIESFGQMLNLMLARPCSIHTNPSGAARNLANRLVTKRTFDFQGDAYKTVPSSELSCAGCAFDSRTIFKCARVNEAAGVDCESTIEFPNGVIFQKA